MKTWRGAVYGIVLIVAAWMAWSTMSNENKPTHEKAFPIVVFVTSTDAVKMTLPETGRVGVVQVEDLPGVFRQHLVQRLSRQVIVVAHPEASDEKALAVLDAARRSKAPEVSLLENVVD